MARRCYLRFLRSRRASPPTRRSWHRRSPRRREIHPVESKNAATIRKALLLGGGLHFLLVRPDLAQRLPVDDVRHGLEGSGLAVTAGRFPPAGRLDAVLLAEQRNEDLRLLL